MKTTKTISGDTWDILAKRLYGNELYMDVLIKANTQHRRTVIFQSGVVLNIPDVDTTAGGDDLNLPPWKQGGE